MRPTLGPCASLLLVATGLGACAAKPFVYQPNRWTVQSPPLAFQVAVLPFADATADFKVRNQVMATGTWNLAKQGWSVFDLSMPRLRPELLAQALAQEMSASALFESARFAPDTTAAQGADIWVRGTVKRADHVAGLNSAFDMYLVFDLRAEMQTPPNLAWQEAPGNRSGNVRAMDPHVHLGKVLGEMFGAATTKIAAAFGPGGLQPPQ